MGVYCQFIEGQGGFITSPGMSRLAAQARLIKGVRADVFPYTQYVQAQQLAVQHYLTKDEIVLVGFSAGCGTANLVAQSVHAKLVVGIDPSRDCYNYPVPSTAEGSILFHNQNWLSHLTGIGGAGEASDGVDLHYKKIEECDENHLFMDLDPGIHAQIIAAIKQIAAQK